MRAAIIGMGDKGIPGTVEGCGLMVAGLSGTNETDRGPVWIAGHGFYKDRVSDVLARANIEIVEPGNALVFAHRDMRVSVGVDIGKIECPVACDADGWIENPRGRTRLEVVILHRAHGPRRQG